MSTTLQAPKLTNTATRPLHSHKLFVNIPVTDLQRSIIFFEALGFSFNAQFTDPTATCMLVGEDAYFMLLTRDKFASFARREIGEPWDETSALFAITVDSRAEVDEMVEKAIAAGGANAADPQDHGFMYVSSFYDPDGHHWEVFWMDPAAVNG
jgi:uncharacterized protein